MATMSLKEGRDASCHSQHDMARSRRAGGHPAIENKTKNRTKRGEGERGGIMTWYLLCSQLIYIE